MANIRNQPRVGIANKGRQAAKGNKGDTPKLGWLISKILIFCLLVLAIWQVWESWQESRASSDFFPIAFVRVEGEIENLDLNKFEQTLKPFVSRGYFTLKMGEITAAVQSFAWVEKVRVDRIWPDTLNISIKEHEPVARWGEKALLDQNSVRFAPENLETFADLPVIYGQPGMEAYLLEMLGTLNAKLEPRKVKVATLDLSKRRAWVVKLDNGLEIHFGRQEPVEALERFLEWIPELGEDAFYRMKRVDLRYSNGFAIVKKTDAELAAQPVPTEGDGTATDAQETAETPPLEKK